MTTDFSTDLIPYSPQAATSGGGGMERGINVMRMLRLRLKLMIAVFVIVAVPAVAAVWLLIPQEYTASEKLQFDSKTMNILSGKGQMQAGEWEKWVFSHAALVNDQQFLTRLLSDPKVRDLPEIRAQDDKPSYLKGRLQARLIPRTDFLEISGTFGDRETAKDIVSSAVGQLEKLALQKEQTFRNERLQSLVKEEQDLDKQYEEQSEYIARLNEQIQAPYLKVPGVGPSGDALQQNLSQLQGEQAQQKNSLLAIETDLSMLAAVSERLKQNPDEPILDFNIEAQAGATSEVQSFRQQVTQLEIKRQNSPWAPGTQAVKQLEDQLSTSQAALKNALRTSRQNSVEARIREATQRKTQLETALKSTEERIANANAQIFQERDSAKVLVGEMERVRKEDWKRDEIWRRLLEVRNRKYQADLEAKEPPRVSRQEGAMAPARPDHGKQFKLAFMALVAAAGLGFGVGLLRELTDQQLHGAEDISGVTPLPLLAAIPHSSADRLPELVDMAMLSRDCPDSTSAEEFRRILSRIIYPTEGVVEVKTILVTSPSRKDGKTTLACNLATALAQANRRVLIVDVNSRRPGVEKAFGLESGPGLAEVLAGDYNADDVVQTTDTENVMVMGPGFTDRDLTGKLASRQALEFFEQAEEHFDHVIIDTPPCLLTSDSKLLAPVMDGVIMVVGVGISTTGMMRRCLQDIQQGGAHVLGVVVNGVRPTRGGDMRRNLDDYYSYHGEGNGATNGNGRPKRARDVEPDDVDDLPAILLLDEQAEPGDKRNRT
ncbi:MAG: polysaccharide biosynthesis tyrosine autokinase [FCB group bacterium]|jgi:capsular exopolysaccharide synthesis family protein|nr:polysaccharide biosynthesis tyrosine autokinase [FCB group bacterium]